jgi:hypothetical protein
MATDIFSQAGVKPTTTGLQPNTSIAQAPTSLVNKLQPIPAQPASSGSGSGSGSSGSGSGSGSGGGSGSGNTPQGKVFTYSSPNPDGTFTLHFSDGTSQVVGTPTSTVAPTGPTQSQMQNAKDVALNQLTQWGIISGPNDPTGSALMSTINTLAMQGAGADTISLAIQQSDAYKQRFIGNQTRIANGLAALSPAEYIATEQAYDQVLRNAGVPAQFYSSSAAKAKLIGADVSATELQQRADLAKQSITNADPFYTSQLQNLYGLSTGDMIAHVLDPQEALPLLQQQVSSTQIAAEAARAGLNTTLATAQQLAGQGVTQAQAQQGFQAIAQQLPGTQALAARYAGYTPEGQVGQALQTATFGAPGTQTQAQAEAQLKRLQTQEVSAFSGSSGAGKGSLGIIDTGGLQ